MAWINNRHETLNSADDHINATSMTPSQFSMYLDRIIPDGSDNIASYFSVNGVDSGGKYTSASTENTGTWGDATSQNKVVFDTGGDNEDKFSITFACDIADQEKLFMSFGLNEKATGTAPTKGSWFWKYVTTGARITSVKDDTTAQSSNFGVGSNISVIGDGGVPVDDLDLSEMILHTIYEESDTGEHLIKVKYGWWGIGSSDSPPTTRGIFTGGTDSNNMIDYITISSTGNGVNFGDGRSEGKMGAAVGDGTLGIYGGDNNVLNFVTMATLGNAQDFGDLTGIGGNATACADATRGVWFRGNINYITMASASNATDWGHDRSPNAGDPCAFADKTRGIVAGGETNEGGWHDINDMDYITIQTISSTTDFGDMTDVKRQLSGVANDTYGFTMCGYNGSSYLSTIDYVTIQTLGNADSFGNLTQARTAQNSACGDSTRAVLGGGYATSSNTDTIDYFTMGTSGSSSNFGDLTSARTRVTSCSDYVK